MLGDATQQVKIIFFLGLMQAAETHPLALIIFS